jgi:hypothetical protein
MPKPYPTATIGQPGPDQYGYLAGLHGAKLEIYASNKAAAMRAALEFWKPFKKDRPYLWVELCETPAGEPVVHTAVN